MDQKDIVRSLITKVGSFIQDRLIDKEQRNQHKEQCAERLAAEDGCSDKDTEVRYSDQAILANLDWGIDALEEAISTSNMETKMARLDYAEKMLQVSAMLNATQKTAGVPNFYLSAWAHLNLSYLWMLRNNMHNAVLHILEMFVVDPFFSRIDFAPELWKHLFLPHMSSVIGWYSEERRKIVMDVIPDSTDKSFTVDFDNYFDESLILSVRPEQAQRIQELEQLYGQSLDENTRLYAKYYKDCMNYDSTTSRKVIPMMPIAEAPMTPLHEVSHSIPDYVQFGPILPKSAGFSPVLKAKENVREASRLKATSTSSENLKDSATWGVREEIRESGDFDDHPDAYIGLKDSPRDTVSNSSSRSEKDDGASSYISNTTRRVKDEDTASKMQLMMNNIFRQSPSPSNSSLANSPRVKNEDAALKMQLKMNNIFRQSPSPSNSSRGNSPRSPATKISSPRGGTNSGKGPTPVLRLLSTRAMDSRVPTSLPGSPSVCDDNSSSSRAESDGELTGQQKTAIETVGCTRSVRQVFPKSFLNENDKGSPSYVSSPLYEMMAPQSRPPKDFVCPITGQIFNDPVTLETGQTYERKAIQEWMNRGNTTCPITRQPLSATSLPKTNYVLKRLITSWKDQHPELAQEFSCNETPRSYLDNSSPKELLSESILSPISNLPTRGSMKNETEHKLRRLMRAALSISPTSVISQAAVETVINALKPYILCLCNSEDLQECEAAVLTIARIWEHSKVDSGIHSYLSSPAIVNGFVEILSASLNRDVLRTTIYILSKLTCADDRVEGLLTSIDSDFYSLAALLDKGLAEAAILMYLLRPSVSQLSGHHLVSSLINIMSNKNEDPTGLQFVIAPKDAAIALLEQIVNGGDENDTLNAMKIVSAHGIPALLNCLNRVDGRQSVVSILLCCIQVDMICRTMVANRIELSPVLELFNAGDDSVRGMCIEFLCQLVQLSSRTLSNQILQIIKDEGAFNTMHALLVYLQMSPMEQKPAVATLLLQLDLLVVPRKMSIYREEAMEALLEALQRKDFPSSQLTALHTLSSLSRHLSTSGKSCLEALLLKTAGYDQPYYALIKEEELQKNDSDFAERTKEEERAARSWEKRVAFVLLNHEKGAIFKALEECLKSNSVEISKSCLILSTWLVYMLYSFPDCGVRDIARKSLLDKFINVLQSSRNLEEKILAALALRGFVSEPDGLNDVGMYTKSIWRILRKLKKSSMAAGDILKGLMNLPCVDAADLWSCNECPELDVSMNGEVLSMVHVRNRLISSHSDGTIKIWDARKRVPRLIQEVREHSKAVTCLYVSPPHDKLYSGSLDRTIRVWTIKQEEIHCIQVHDVKEAVHELTANDKAACFSSQGTGVKVYYWSGVPKHINFNKNVKCLAVTGEKLYCGCTGYSIQEVDLRTLTSTAFYSGPKKLLGKQTIFSLEIFNGLIFAGGSLVDGIAGKVFSLSSKAVIGSLSTGFDIQRMVVNSDFLFAASKCGIIEVWLKERVTKIAYIKTGLAGNAKIVCLATDSEGQRLFAGSSDGKLQAWSLD